MSLASPSMPSLAGSPFGWLTRLRLSHLLLVVCVAVVGWLVFVPLSALMLTAFTEDNIYGFGASDLR